jgi:hypothetical protein
MELEWHENTNFHDVHNAGSVIYREHDLLFPYGRLIPGIWDA